MLGLGSSLSVGQSLIENVNFVSTWTVSGDETARTITLPLVQNNKAGSGNDINFTIDWGDGTAVEEITAYNDADRVHIYGTNGTYTVTMTGTIQGFKFDNSGDKTKLATITNWGTFNFTNEDTFYGCSNLNVTATDVPIVSTTSLALAFNGCTALTSIGGNWDVSSVTAMNYLFANCTNFNQDIGSWDVSSVTAMNNMFADAAAFNQNISGWDVGEVTNMKSMFWGATAFNNGGVALTESGNNWDMAKVENCENMLRSATSFNQDISDWTVSAVTNMKRMFHTSTAFNQNIGSWNTSSVTNMYEMLANIANFNQDISSWDVNQVSNFTNFLVNNAALTTANYNKLLHHWHSDDPTDSLSFHGGDATTDSSSGGVDGTAARAALVLATGSGGDGWTITDGD